MKIAHTRPKRRTASTSTKTGSRQSNKRIPQRNENDGLEDSDDFVFEDDDTDGSTYGKTNNPKNTSSVAKSRKRAASSSNKNKSKQKEGTKKGEGVDDDGKPKAKKKKTKDKELLVVALPEVKDWYIWKSVAFSVHCSYGQDIVSFLGGKEALIDTIHYTDEDAYIFGTIIRKSPKSTETVTFYDIQWEKSNLKICHVDQKLLKDAINRAKTIKKVLENGETRKCRQDPYRPMELFGASIADALRYVEEDEVGDANDSESSGSELDELEYLEKERKAEGTDKPRIVFVGKEQDMEDVEEERRKKAAEKGSGRKSKKASEKQRDDDIVYKWRVDTKISGPMEKSVRAPSSVKETMRGHFMDPLSSFLAFIPLKVFKSMVYYSNQHALQTMKKKQTNLVGGKPWRSDISLDEMMRFFGILIAMTLRPTPGLEYRKCWDDQGWHPYTRNMELGRFRQIRSVLQR